MEKIHDKIYPLEPDEMDNLIYKNCILLSWAEPKHFFKERNNYIYDNFLTDIFRYFDKIEKEKSPRKKLLNMSQLFASIENLILNENIDTYRRIGIYIYDGIRIDILCALLNYGLIKAHPLNINTNCKFMDLFLHDKRNKVEGSQLKQLQCTCELISNIDNFYLHNVTKETFNKNCCLASHNGE